MYLEIHKINYKKTNRPMQFKAVKKNASGLAFYWSHLEKPDENEKHEMFRNTRED